MQKITPFLWFDGRAEEAARFYTSIFKKSKVGRVTHYAEGTPGRAGTVMTVPFQLGGQKFVALNGGPQFPFTEAISFVVNCETQREIDYFWKALSAGGKTIQCGWLKDKFGVCWQIIPTILSKYLQDRNPKKAARVMHAILAMVKIDIKTLQQAYKTKQLKI
jgi:predicted 3-demethylubiquinone-9 3-methyltransferase (glyoxalase superfamily)